MSESVNSVVRPRIDEQWFQSELFGGRQASMSAALDTVFFVVYAISILVG
jgi:hypothetical protein